MSDDAKQTELLGDVLGALSGPPGPRLKHCPGAALRVDRGTYSVMAGNGTKWVTPIEEIPRDGSKAWARIACENQVTEVIGIGGRLVQHATCPACHAREDAARTLARELEPRR